MGDLFLFFPESQKRAEILEYCAKRLETRFLVLDEPASGLLTVELKNRDLEFEATHLKLLKPVNQTALDGEDNRQEFDVYTRDVFKDVNSDTFFLPCERAHIAQLVLLSFTIDDEFRKLISGMETKHKFHEETPLVSALQRLELLENYAPLHTDSKKKTVFPKFQLIPNTQAVRNYYGEEVAFYFAWMNHFTLWLVFPAVVGLAYYLYTQKTEISVDNNPYVPFFSFGMVIWATLFNKFWRRESNRWAQKWGTLNEEDVDEIRPEFTGTMRKSPITGLMERYSPDWLRYCKYFGSALVTSVMLFIAFSVMVCSLNLQGYIHNNGMFHVPALAKFSAPGEIFDPVNGDFLPCLVPTIVHSLAIMVLNQYIYRRIAVGLTDWENHRTESSFENSLILKRFLFEAFDCYISLFYLAFYELDVMKVRTELVALYTADCIRRLLTETVIPLLLQLLSARGERDNMKRLKDKYGEKESVTQALEDSKKDKYEQFDDFLEMVIEFGYVTMFASAFPLGAALSLVYNVVEMKSDAIKLSWACQRPPSMRAANIGTWQTVLSTMTVLAAITNVMIFGFGSDQMMEWLPGWYTDLGGKRELAEGMGRFVVGGVFVIEHVVLMVVMFLHYAIPDMPSDVQVEVARRAYEDHKAFLKAKKQERLRLSGKLKVEEPVAAMAQ
ncbi:hypothetical protein CYMTET_52480 [Cymbomonas tetramitiformis]|uniref:Anoctamin transmembrane domain-containing protein n=1 Tax=Cymbomonas tetramitiformis TaxID=36881 RepID=A0AAE0BIX9_9CHLO|nr:hypothetical protein CYMTET_52480 [Cymbomonas tetramitiformis]